MFKTLCLTAVFVLCIFRSDLVSAQTTNNQAESRSRAKLVENPLAVSGETEGQAVSPEASAEARNLYKEAVKYGRSGLYKQAADLFQRSLKLNPDNADAYQGLGHAYLDLGQWKEAVKALQQAITLNPNDKDARTRLDQAQQMLQRETGQTEEKSVAEGTGPKQPVGVPVSMNVPTLSPSVSSTKISAAEMSLIKVYRAGPGDVLDVRLGEPGSTRSTLFTITPSGLLEHPSFTDPLPVVGLTVEEIIVRLEADLKRRALADNPKVSVGVRD